MPQELAGIQPKAVRLLEYTCPMTPIVLIFFSSPTCRNSAAGLTANRLDERLAAMSIRSMHINLGSRSANTKRRAVSDLRALPWQPLTLPHVVIARGLRQLRIRKCPRALELAIKWKVRIQRAVLQ